MEDVAFNITEGKELAQGIKAAEKSIALWENRIKDAKKGKFTRAVQGELTTNEELKALIARKEALKEEFEYLKLLAFPKATPEEIAIKGKKTRLLNQNAELRERLRKGDFTTKKRKEYDASKDSEFVQLKVENEILKDNVNQENLRLKRRNLTKFEKVRHFAAEVFFNLPRAFITALDLSAVLRQGGFLVLGNPVRAIRNIKTMLKALADEKFALEVELKIHNRPNAKFDKRADLFLPRLKESNLAKQEELFRSRLSEKIGFIRLSNRAFITFLNVLRADTLDAMLESLPDPSNPSNEELKALGNGINIFTGRGNLGKNETAASVLAAIFFSPKNLISRFQILALQPFYQGTKETRKILAREYGKTLIGLTVFYALMSLDDEAEVERDPRSSDFAKVRFGNTRVDPIFGLSQSTVLTTRLSLALANNLSRGHLNIDEFKSLSGKTKRITGENVPFGSSTSADVIGRFIRTKLAPVPSNAVDILTGSNVVGKKVTPANVLANLTIPLSMRDIYDAMIDQGYARGTILGMLSIFGMSLQSFEIHKAAKKRKR